MWGETSVPLSSSPNWALAQYSAVYRPHLPAYYIFKRSSTESCTYIIPWCYPTISYVNQRYLRILYHGIILRYPMYICRQPHILIFFLFRYCKTILLFGPGRRHIGDILETTYCQSSFSSTFERAVRARVPPSIYSTHGNGSK